MPRHWHRPRKAPALPAAPALRFSFKYLDTGHPSFRVSERDGHYFRTLLARLKELSELHLSEFQTTRSSTLRIHPIDFDDHRVTVKTFGIPGGTDFDQKAWQFALSANEHGRVHGFLLENTFFVRWLDPEHNLYAGSR